MVTVFDSIHRMVSLYYFFLRGNFLYCRILKTECKFSVLICELSYAKILSILTSQKD